MIRVTTHLLNLEREEPVAPSLPIAAPPGNALAVLEPHSSLAFCTSSCYTLSHDREAWSLLLTSRGVLTSGFQSLPYSGPCGCCGSPTPRATFRAERRMKSSASSTGVPSTRPSGQPCFRARLPEVSSLSPGRRLISVTGAHLLCDHRVAHRRQDSAKSAVKELTWPRF